MIDHLIFDTTDFTSIDDTHSVGAFVRSGKSGALITHHSSSEAGNITFAFVDGDVTIGTETIAETAHGLSTGDVVRLTTTGVLPAGLALATDYYVIRVDANSFRLAFSAKNAERGIAVDITAAAGGGTHTVTEQEVQRRALDVWMVNPIDVNITQADEITVFQGTIPWVIGDGGGSITVDGTVAATQSGTWTVGLSEDHNYGAVGANTLRTAAQIGNATGAANFNAGAADAQTLRVVLASGGADPALAGTAIAHAANPLNVADTPENVVASPLTDRKYLFIYNNDNTKVYIGASGVSAATGFPVSPGSYLELRAGAAVDIEFVGQAGRTPEIRTLEIS